MKPIPFALLALLLLALTPGAAQAQADQPQKQSGEAASGVPTTYVYGAGGAGTPADVARVRRRIAEIGGRGAAQRVVYPILFVVPPGSGAATPATPSPLPAIPQTSPPGRQFTQADLNRMKNDLDEMEDDLVRRLDDRFDDLNDRLDDLEDAARAPEPRPQVARVEGALLDTGLFSTTNVIFEFDKSTLLPVSERILDAVGEVMRRHPDLRLEVTGHTDSRGAEAYNRRLSEARAQAVRGYLLDRFALAAGRIEARGYGETRPVASNANDTGRALNRRVEFRVLNPEFAQHPR